MYGFKYQRLPLILKAIHTDLILSTVPLHWTHPVKDISSFTAAQDKVRVYGFKYQRQSLDVLDVAYVSLVP